jgi:hypothetical protein
MCAEKPAIRMSDYHGFPGTGAGSCTDRARISGPGRKNRVTGRTHALMQPIWILQKTEHRTILYVLFCAWFAHTFPGRDAKTRGVAAPGFFLSTTKKKCTCVTPVRMYWPRFSGS